MRTTNKLKEKIKEKCGNTTNFAILINHSRSGVYKIINGKRKGSTEFWLRTQRVLKIADKDMWEYMNTNTKEGEGKCREAKK
jgi:plasmid maintenance system antidote protein VapI